MQMWKDDFSVSIDSMTGNISEVKIGTVKSISAVHDRWFFQNDNDFFSVNETENSVVYDEYSPYRSYFRVENPGLSENGFKHTIEYYWENDILLKKVVIENNSGEGFFLSAMTSVELYENYYKQGDYYVPNFDYRNSELISSRERVRSLRSEELNSQMISFSNKGSFIGTLSYTRDAYPVFPESMNGGASFYIPGGWEQSSYYGYIGDGESIEYEVAIMGDIGSPSKMLRQWPQLEKVSSLRQEIWQGLEMPSWLGQVCITGFVYEPSQLLNYYNFKNSVGVLSNSLPGYYLVVYWGASMQSGGETFEGEYGTIAREPYCQPIPAQQADKDWTISGLSLTRRDCPKIKFGHYIGYHWTIDENSEESMLHDDWKAKNHYGEYLYTEPSRILRNINDVAARDYCSHMTELWYQNVPLDFNYVDGGDGKYLLYKDWAHNSVTDWKSWHQLFKGVYQSVHASDLSPKMQVNNGQCFVSDFIVEELAQPDLWLDENWRILSDAMERAKLWQPPHGYTSVLYWTDQSTGSLKNDYEYISHILTYGLLPNLMPNNPSSSYQGWCMDRVPYIIEAYGLRNAELVYPDMTLDWRSGNGVAEITVLKIGDKKFRINVINHDPADSVVDIEFDFTNLISASNINLEHKVLIEPEAYSEGNYSDVYTKIKDWNLDTSESKRVGISLNAEYKKLNVIDLLEND
ncbi:MAG: hypothetical protein ACIAQZ_09925 [Sedimentisphaeraceae bacterium JB056]